MTVNYVYLGYGTTDENGECKLDHDANGDSISHSYTGTGAGKIDVVASLDSPSSISDSSLVSETFVVYDCILYDNATISSHNDSMWSVETGLQLSRYTDYSEVAEVSTANANMYCTIPSECVVELDLKQIGGTNGNFWLNLKTTSNAYKSGTNLNNVGGSVETWTHLKLEFENGVCTYTNMNNNQSTTFNTGITDANMRFALNTGNNITAHQFKNFKVYPI